MKLEAKKIQETQEWLWIFVFLKLVVFWGLWDLHEGRSLLHWWGVGVLGFHPQRDAWAKDGWCECAGFLLVWLENKFSMLCSTVAVVWIYILKRYIFFQLMSFVGCWNWKYITWWQVSWTCYAEYGSTDPQWICGNAEELFHLWLQGHLAEQLEGRETLLQDRVCWLQDDGKMYDIKLIQTYYHDIVLGISTGKMKRCNSSVLLQLKKMHKNCAKA